MEHKCPLCNGLGKVPDKKPPEKSMIQHWAIELRDAGLTIREIMKILGYNSPGSIWYLIKKKKRL